MMRNQRLFAIAAALAVGLTAGAAHAIDSAGCRNFWEDSSAYDTCESGTVRSYLVTSTYFGFSENGNSCHISTRCLRPHNLNSSHYYVSAVKLVVPPEDTEDLQNCTGTLKVSSC